MLWLVPALAVGAGVALVARDAGRSPVAAGEKPELLLMTALPILWGEGGVADVLAGRAGPSPALRSLEADYAVSPVDALSKVALAGKRLILVAQPRALAPGELFDLDAWVRGGGKALILTDPALMWPSEFGLGDPRRPPVEGLLSPLLAHWELELQPPAEDAAAISVRNIGGRAVRLAAPGQLRSKGSICRVAEEGLVARCRIGGGEAVIVADADILDERLWGEGVENMAAVGAWLSELSQ